MKRTLLPTAFVLLVASCGVEPGEPAAPAAGVVTATLPAVDSIGILMGDSNYTFGAIADFAPLEGGGVAVLDRIAERVSIFDGEGVFVRSFGRHGEAPGEFQWPASLCVLPSGTILVLEGASGKVNVFDSTGAFLSSWMMEGMGIYPMEAEAFDDSSFVAYDFSMDMDENGLSTLFTLWRYDAFSGEVLSRYVTWEAPSSESTDFTGAFLVFATDCAGRMYLSRAASDRWMVEVFESAEAPADTLLCFPGLPRIAVESDSQHVPGVPRISYMYQDSEQGNMASGTTNMPVFMPFVAGLEVGPGGNLWVLRGGPGASDWDEVTPAGEPVGIHHMALGDSSSVILLEASASGGIYAFDAVAEDYHRLYRMEP